MAALEASASASVSSSWIPEDDILLKNAVEAGASLEALAKGAVRFSRKFTVQELQDRWHSLLYDPIISVEASARMVEFENNPPKSIRSGVSTDKAEFPQKRKVESIRKMYFSLRKKTCVRHLNSSDISFLGSPNVNDSIGDSTGCHDNVRLHHENPVRSSMLGDYIQNCYDFQKMDVDILHHRPKDYNLIKESVEREYSAHILGETLVDFGNCSGVEEMGPSVPLPESGASFHSLGYSSPQPRTPLWKSIEDISAPPMPINESHGDKVQGSEGTSVHPDNMNEEKISSRAIPESHLADLSDSLLNFGNEDELHFMNADGKDTIDKSCYDSINSILLGSPNDVIEDDVPDVKEPPTCLAIPGGSYPAELEVTADQSHSSHGNQASNIFSEVNVTSPTLIPNLQSHELQDVEMFCTLNSEDPEIPCNDVFFTRKVVASSALRTNCKETSDLVSSFATRKNGEQKLSMMEKEVTSPQKGGSDMFPGTSHNHQLVSCGVKSDSPDANCLSGVYKQASNAHADPSQHRSPLSTPKSVTYAGHKEGSPRLHNTADVPLNKKSSSAINAFLKPEANPSTLDQEASLDQGESESDDDIPYFSDIESLILDMDLCPEDPDQCFSREVLKYQHEDTKRTIIRLEQCAQSSMQRAIAYRGAFAIFYGRHLKHYMKETEVILGRATVDFDVDIDLGREGQANKISRRQALIRMEGDGSFILKNLGKSSIFLNGKEIATGQGHCLSSSSLIEIREMAFMFEINHKSVRQYVAKVEKRNGGKNTIFEWSEEKVPP